MIHELKLLLSSVFILCTTLFLSASSDINTTSNEKIETKSIYTKYTKIPKIVYTKQRFSVTIQAHILISRANIAYRISTNIDKQNSSLELLNEDIIWYKVNDNLYESTLQFKVTNDNVQLPKITISLIDDENEFIDKSVLQNKKIIYRKIAINQKKYSNIIASEFEVKNIKTKQYTNKELIHVLSIKAVNSNLEEFYLSAFENQGTKVLNSISNTQMLYYFIITPISQRSIDFNYFNTKENRFIDIGLAINIEEKLVSTQTDLNPYENDMKIYKSVAIAMIVLFFLMVYFFKREFFFLFFAVLFMTLLIYMLYPNKSFVLNEDVKVYILPTQNSTVFNILGKEQRVQLLIKKDKFSKVLFENGSIGWIKNGKI